MSDKIFVNLNITSKNKVTFTYLHKWGIPKMYCLKIEKNMQSVYCQKKNIYTIQSN